MAAPVADPGPIAHTAPLARIDGRGGPAIRTTGAGWPFWVGAAGAPRPPPISQATPGIVRRRRSAATPGRPGKRHHVDVRRGAASRAEAGDAERSMASGMGSWVRRGGSRAGRCGGERPPAPGDGPQGAGWGRDWWRATPLRPHVPGQAPRRPPMPAGVKGAGRGGVQASRPAVPVTINDLQRRSRHPAADISGAHRHTLHTRSLPIPPTEPFHHGQEVPCRALPVRSPP